MPDQKLELVVEASDDGDYTALAPGLPGCTAHGETVEEALKNMKREIRVYLEGLMQEILAGAKQEDLV